MRSNDGQSGKDAATEVAEKIVASRAAVVIGSSYSTASLEQGPIRAKAGLASLCPTATSDAVTDNATTFRIIFKNSQQAETLAVYLAKVPIAGEALQRIGQLFDIGLS